MQNKKLFLGVVKVLSNVHYIFFSKLGNDW